MVPAFFIWKEEYYMSVKAYEVMYIVNPTADELLEEVNNKFKTLIENNGGSVNKIDIWGRKRLAYEMSGFNEGLYVLIDFNAESIFVKELDRVLKITESILRYMIIRKGE